MRRLGKLLLLTTGVASLALAQAPEVDEFGPPPLVAVEDAAPETDAPVAQPVPQEVLQPQAIANPPLEEVAAKVREEPPGRGLRIGMGLLFGAGVGAAGGVLGGLLGGATLPDASLQPLGAAWTGAAIGFGLTAPLGVLLSGWLFDGDGSVWATFFGDLLGAGIAAGAVLFGGTAGAPLLFALPLGGSVVGYEVTSPAAKSLVVAASLTSLPGGALLGVAGGF
ncbi:MAG: hypothetical protein AB1938_05760 [Myxococcota bacterium]